MKILLITTAIILLSGCGAAERAEISAKAKTDMIGMPKSEIMACMGAPKSKANDGNAEVWTYHSEGGDMGKYGKAYCDVNILFEDGSVIKVTYAGATGGAVFKDTQCAYAVSQCLKQ